MATIRDIKRRIKSVKNTRQITKAMKMVSAAKLRRAQEDIFALRPYADKIKEITEALSKNVEPESNPLLLKPSAGESAPTGKIELILITSDRGLCGGFNSQLIRTAERFARENEGRGISLNIIGRRAVDYYKNKSLAIVQTRSFGSGRPDYKTAALIARDVMDRYLKEGSDEAYIIYSEFKSVLTQRPLVERLLPIALPEKGESSHEDILFEPSERFVLEKLIPKFVEVRIFKALVESRASEHGARMTAMDSASKNASEMIDYLTLKFNRARQATITKELMEIIGGAEALK